MKKVCSLFFPLFIFALLFVPTCFGADYGQALIGDTAGLPKAELKSVIGNLIKVALSFLGVVALLIVMTGGFKYMISGGNEEKMKDARKFIVSGIVGITIILLSYAITNFVFESLTTAIGTAEISGN